MGMLMHRHLVEQGKPREPEKKAKEPPKTEPKPEVAETPKTETKQAVRRPVKPATKAKKPAK